MSSVLAGAGPSAYWYLTRSTGAVALMLLTAAIVLGVADVRRWSTPRWPRFVVDSLHRNVSLLAMAFLAVHILTSVLDSFAPISLLDAFIPFTGSYRPFWLGLGALSFDLLLAVTITSLLRQRIGFTGWRAVHWLTYASWPIALLHGLGTGSDVKSTWLLALSIACLLVVLAAVLVRAIAGWPANMRGRGAALGGRRRVLAVPGAVAARRAARLRMGAALGDARARCSRTPTPPAPAGKSDERRARSARARLPRSPTGSTRRAARACSRASPRTGDDDARRAPRRARTGSRRPAAGAAATGLRRGADRGDRARGPARARRRGFPTATKMRAVAAARGRAVVVVNGAEGEPASLKDRTLLELVPHLVLDGAALAAEAVGADEVIVVRLRVRRRRPRRHRQRRSRNAQAAYGRGRGSPRVRLVAVPGHYVAGQESALVNYLGGGPAKPTFTPPMPFEQGVRRRPTLVNNVETLAHIALIARHGARLVPGPRHRRAAGLGARHAVGAGRPPGRLRDRARRLAVLADRGRRGRHRARARGAAGRLRGQLDQRRAAVGGWRCPTSTSPPTARALGAGVVLLLSEDACPVAETARVARWLAGQSARQCGPCVHGLDALAETIEQIAAVPRGARPGERLQRLASLTAGAARAGTPTAPSTCS